MSPPFPSLSLAPRQKGRRGIGPGAARDWWAWPTEPAAHAKYAAGFVAHWVAAKKRLEDIAGAPFARTYLAGSSNGAYFLTTLALRGELGALGLRVDAYGAMSGGSAGGRSAAQIAALPPTPFYVGFGTYDEETKTSARALAALLRAAHWPVRVAEHPVAHGAREEYLDEAFVFWDEGDGGAVP
jgi:predicted esterase